MPLRPGASKAVVSQNIREFHTGPTFRHTAAKFGKERANKQAIAVALHNARKYAYGGPPAPKPPGLAKPVPLGAAPKEQKVDLNPNEGIDRMAMRGSLYGLRHEGMINSTVPGRTDKLPMNVKAGSYVLPADIPSALGQGNSMAGGQLLKHMFSSGPAGPAMRGAGRTNMPRMNFVKPPSMGRKMGFADGGTKGEQPQSGDAKSGMDESVDHVPIIAAGGEYIIHPDVVRDIGNGDVKAGHRVLDRFVLSTRKKHIETLKKLKPPKK